MAVFSFCGMIIHLYIRGFFLSCQTASLSALHIHIPNCAAIEVEDRLNVSVEEAFRLYLKTRKKKGKKTVGELF
jgi:hypothetical protein